MHSSNLSPKLGIKRNSNIELLRIIAMFMVLALHVNFMTIGEPTTEETINSPVSTFLRVFFQMSCNIAVNLFVLISGWFGIKFSYKGMIKFTFQCVFILTFMYILGLCVGNAVLAPKYILECFFLEDNAWFVKAYLFLFALSPVLNAYCANTDPSQQKSVLITFFVLQTVFGCFTMSATFIKAGFSTLSFIGLYLLARYVSLYGKSYLKYGKYLWMLSTIGQVVWFYLPLRFGIMRLSYMSILYTAPLCITGALGLLMWFSSFKVRDNTVINFIAASCFAVFLCHICNSWTGNCFMSIAKSIYDSYNGISYLSVIFIYILGVFVVAVLIDQVRKLCWRLLEKRVNIVGKSAIEYNSEK